jgi:hypothetical protein
MLLESVTGLQGAVHFGPIQAATLRSCRLDARNDSEMTWTLTGTAVNVNRFYITQTPLSVSLRVGSRNWRWRDVVLEIVGGKVQGTVSGRPEVR